MEEKIQAILDKFIRQSDDCFKDGKRGPAIQTLKIILTSELTNFALPEARESDVSHWESRSRNC